MSPGTSRQTGAVLLAGICLVLAWLALHAFRPSETGATSGSEDAQVDESTSTRTAPQTPTPGGLTNVPKTPAPRLELRSRPTPARTQELVDPPADYAPQMLTIDEIRHVLQSAGGPVNPENPQPRVGMTSRIDREIAALAGRVGPFGADYGTRLLATDDPHLRVLGAALLAKAMALDKAATADVADDDDLSVPMQVLEWLYDTGRGDAAVNLQESLLHKYAETDAIQNALLDGAFSEGGGRTALDLIRDVGGDDAIHDVCTALSEDPAQPYAIRMKSLLELRSSVEFDAFRERVRELAEDVDQTERWSAGIEQLARGLNGPAEVMRQAPTLSPATVTSFLIGENPQMLEDLALTCEYVATHADARVAQGTTAYLTQQISVFADRPLGEEPRAALTRIRRALAGISDAERLNHTPPRQGGPPPGANR